MRPQAPLIASKTIPSKSMKIASQTTDSSSLQPTLSGLLAKLSFSVPLPMTRICRTVSASSAYCGVFHS
jgi:hypothetical protein